MSRVNAAFEVHSEGNSGLPAENSAEEHMCLHE